MDLRFKIKTRLMQMLLERKRKERFDAAACDVFQLPSEAGPLINNSYFFGGNTEAGESLIMRLAFRNTGFVELFVIFRDESGRFLTVEKQAYPTDECPLKVTCVEPGKAWHLLFDGCMVDEKKGMKYRCRFDVTYRATLEPFSALHHSDFRGMAEAFAREKWNKQFFQSLTGDTGMRGGEKKYAQLHYEQTGRFEGRLTLVPQGASDASGKTEDFVISMTAGRDHSFGKRDWNFMNNHIWLLLMTDKGEVINFSLVNYPHAKRIFCGYSNFGETRNYSLVNYRMKGWDHLDGKGPDAWTVACDFANGQTLEIKVQRVDNVVTPFDGGNFYFQEGVGDFEVNGVKARGSIEYGFNKDKSRWDSYYE